MRLSELKWYLRNGSNKQKALFNKLLRQNKYRDINLTGDSITKLFPGLYSSKDDTIVYADPSFPKKHRRRTVSRKKQTQQARDLSRMIQQKQRPAAEQPKEIQEFLKMMSDPTIPRKFPPRIPQSRGAKESPPASPRRKRKRPPADQQIVLPSTHASRGGRGGRKLTDYLNGLHKLPPKLQKEANKLNSWERRLFVWKYLRANEQKKKKL